MKKIAVALIILLSGININAKPAPKLKAELLFNFVKQHEAELAVYVKRSTNFILPKHNQKQRRSKSAGPTKEELAFATVKEAAEDGYVPAQDLLAYCYATGTGTKSNAKLAFSWYLCAALAGSDSAKESLIACFEEGIGVIKDVTIAQTLRTLLKSPAN